MNKVILVGNLTRDPELAQTPSGISVCKFSIAVNRDYTNANGERDADFINIVTWRNLADNCAKYLVKGSKVAVCGSLQTSSYEDRNGEKRYRTDVVADNVEFISTKSKEDAEPPQTSKKSVKKTLKELQPTDNDGLPF